MRQMKDSEIEWVGEIPQDWVVKKAFQMFCEVKKRNVGMLEDNLLSLSYGKIKRKDVNGTDGLLPESFEGYNVVEKDDIVLRLTDLQNDHKSLRVGLCKERGIITSAYVTLRNKSDNFPLFLALQLHAFDVAKGFYGMGGGVRQSLNWEGLKNHLLVIPSFVEQKNISEYLDEKCTEIDNAIAKTTASIEEYKKLKQAIITKAVTKGIRGNRPMKDSGIEWIGEIPADWIITKLGNFVNISSGISVGRVYPAGTKLVEVPYLRVANVQGDYLDLKDVATIKVTPVEAIQYQLKPGELLMTEGGDRDKLGRGCIWNGEIVNCIHQNHVFAVQPNEFMYVEYLNYLTTSDVARTYFDITAKKTTNLACTSKSGIQKFLIPVPTTAEQREIVNYINEKVPLVDNIIGRKQQLITELEAYKKSLIYEYVTGKKEVV